MLDTVARPAATLPKTVASPFSGTRITSLDVFRGATMLFMASEILHIAAVARQFPSSGTARFLADMLDHRP